MPPSRAFRARIDLAEFGRSTMAEMGSASHLARLMHARYGPNATLEFYSPSDSCSLSNDDAVLPHQEQVPGLPPVFFDDVAIC